MNPRRKTISIAVPARRILSHGRCILDGWRRSIPAVGNVRTAMTPALFRRAALRNWRKLAGEAGRVALPRRRGRRRLSERSDAPAAAREIAAGVRSGAWGRGAGGGGRGQDAGTSTASGVGSRQSAVGSAGNSIPFSRPPSPVPRPQSLRPSRRRRSPADGGTCGGGGRRAPIDAAATWLTSVLRPAACLAFAIHHFQAAGGVLVGNPGDDSHTAGLKFWDAGSRPLSMGGSLEPIVERYHNGNAQPARTYGELTRCQAEGPYLAQMSEHYHALRPLCVVVDSASKPTVDFLQRLAATVACEVIACRTTQNDLPRQICEAAAHFAVCIDGDGETCRVFDEQGRAVSAERLLVLLAADAAGVDSYKETPPEVVVLETETSRAVADRLEKIGMKIVTSSPRRADMYDAILERKRGQVQFVQSTLRAVRQIGPVAFSGRRSERPILARRGRPAAVRCPDDHYAALDASQP